MEPFRLFLAHSFAVEKVNGISDAELAELVVNWIRAVAGDRIEIVRTRDPFHGYVSSSVRQDICSADGVLCLFTKRTLDQLSNKWISSTYVMSEASAALMQFSSEEETHRRLFGLVEEGVDDDQLGMAFHGNKTAARFRRDDLVQLKWQVERIVNTILHEKTPVPPRTNCQYLSIDKVVSIWRSGAVWIETRHRFRLTAEMTTVRIPHIMWRISNELPELKTLLSEPRDSKAGFLRVMPLNCGHHDPDHCRCEIRPGGPTRWGYERNFFVEFSDVRVHPGEELAYEIIWGYPDAFHNHAARNLPDENPNSVGLRTSGRGAVESASLTLKFERDWEGEPFRTLEQQPQLSITDANDLPGSHTPEDFLHRSPRWKWITELRACRKRSSALCEVYHWTTGPFHGMAKAIWIPYINYFDTTTSRARRSAPLTDDPAPSYEI